MKHHTPKFITNYVTQNWRTALFKTSCWWKVIFFTLKVKNFFTYKVFLPKFYHPKHSLQTFPWLYENVTSQFKAFKIELDNFHFVEASSFCLVSLLKIEVYTPKIMVKCKETFQISWKTHCKWMENDFWLKVFSSFLG